jgi:predicted metal-dependent phosphotriesterase family hydrolase
VSGSFHDSAGGAFDRRGLLRRGAGALVAAGLTGSILARSAGGAPSAARAPAGRDVDNVVLETATGPVRGTQITKALAHEHLFVDFYGPTDPRYMDIDWTQVNAACLASLQTLRSQGVNLLADWTNIGVGRNALFLRDMSRRSGMNILCATGIYKSLVPPEFRGMTIDQIAGHFFRELTRGIDGTTIRAAWIKIATTESGPTRSDTRLHRAAARAARRARSTISLHSPFADATDAVVRTLVSEGFNLRRFVWGHAQPSSVEDHQRLARRGAMLQYDAISAASDPFFHGPTDDESMLERIAAMVDAGYGDRVMVTTDASVFVNPPEFQYDRNNAYVYATFEPKLIARIGAEATARVLRDNVIWAFRRGGRVR